MLPYAWYGKVLGFAVVAAGVTCAPPMFAQILHATGTLPSFEVVSVRPSSQDERPGRTARADRFEMKAASLKEMVTYAFGIVYDHQLSGGPGWAGTDEFTIEAKPSDAEVAALSKLPGDDLEEQMRLMMQSLLADRFHLKVSFETKRLPVYALVVSKGGLKCTKDSVATEISGTSRPRFAWSAAPPPPPPPPGYVPPPPDEARRLARQPMHFRTKGWPFWMVVTMLSHQPEVSGHPVIDRTGLDGGYDCDASWSREGSDGPGASFFTAIQEQMGLKLEPGRADVETVVVDHADRPSEN